jgi:hemoglobin
MSKHDVENRADIELIIAAFYEKMLADPIIGFIFLDVAKIDLEEHLPIIVDFWFDILFRSRQTKRAPRYKGNTLEKHLQLNKKVALKPGHFTRWLYLFCQAVDAHNVGAKAELMKERAELVAKSISATIVKRKKASMSLALPKKN